MSLRTVSARRNRVYERAFDHEEARELRAQGFSYPALAERFGVSVTAVVRVCDENQRARMAANARRHLDEHKIPCANRCGNLIFHNSGTNRSGLCGDCWQAARTAAIAARNERAGLLRCLKCETWKPDEEFCAVSRPTRRGRKRWCRACENAARQRNREQNAERERTYAREWKRKGRQMSMFVVLFKADDGRWEECARGVSAASRRHAIEQVADREGTYVATTEGQMTELPVRSTRAFKIDTNGASGD